MQRFSEIKISYLFKHIFCVVALILAVIPGFNHIGDLFFQVLLTAVLSFLAVLVSDLFLKLKPQDISGSLFFMMIFWVIIALVSQIKLHFDYNDFSFKWFYLFYYDKPTMIFVVFFVVFLYFFAKLMLCENNNEFIESYNKFIKLFSKTFLIYYFLILFYSFYLVREITFIRPEANFTPFEMIKFTFSRGYIDYELIFLFLGNIMIFLPLGVIFSSLKNKKIFLVIFPIILSFAIELSQYYLGNGHPDIDDLILNVSGFYIGLFLGKLINFSIVKATDSKITSLFSLR